jgi:hypothetical protein
MDSTRERLADALERARRLALETEHLLKAARRGMHESRNTRQHAVLLRELGKLRRRARAG